MNTDTTIPCNDYAPELGRMGPDVAAATLGGVNDLTDLQLACTLPVGHPSPLHEWTRPDDLEHDDLPNLLAVSWDPTRTRGAALFAHREPASWTLDGDRRWSAAEHVETESEAVEGELAEFELVDPEPYIVASLLVRLRSVGELEVTVRYPEPDGDELQNLAALTVVDDVARGARAVLRGEARS